MKYLIQGWQKFDFVLAPDEFKRILEPYHMVVPNAHVPLDYVESSLDEYMAKYEQLYRWRRTAYTNPCQSTGKGNAASALRFLQR